jgi:hypothetical protein
MRTGSGSGAEVSDLDKVFKAYDIREVSAGIETGRDDIADRSE